MTDYTSIKTVLLIGEASGVHATLKKGLEEHGVVAHHMIQYAGHQGRMADGVFSQPRGGILGKITRNLEPLVKVSALPKYDVINFLNSISAVHGTITRYRDIPIIKRKARLLSYYAVGCDEIGIVRENQDLKYSPCKGCSEDNADLFQACQSLLHPRYQKSLNDVRTNFDFAACSMVEYSHVSLAFEYPVIPIALPIDIGAIPFTPASARGEVRLVHAPTRRGYKGTALIIDAIDRLSKVRSDFSFKIVEGVTHARFLEEMRGSDIVIDQLHSQSAGIAALEMMAAGKVVLTGATISGQRYNPAFISSPAVNAEPDPERLAISLAHLLDNKSSFAALAAQGRAYVARSHSPSDVAAQFLLNWSGRARGGR